MRVYEGVVLISPERNQWNGTSGPEPVDRIFAYIHIRLVEFSLRALIPGIIRWACPSRRFCSRPNITRALSASASKFDGCTDSQRYFKSQQRQLPASLPESPVFPDSHENGRRVLAVFPRHARRPGRRPARHHTTTRRRRRR